MKAIPCKTISYYRLLIQQGNCWQVFPAKYIFNHMFHRRNEKQYKAACVIPSDKQFVLQHCFTQSVFTVQLSCKLFVIIKHLNIKILLIYICSQTL